MKNALFILVILRIMIPSSNLLAQTKQLTLTNGDGWYRIISDAVAVRAGGMVKIYGTSGNNRSTLITMNVSLMRFQQGGSINITDNLYYNSNHVDQIRGGSVSNQELVLDIHFVGINNPSNLWVDVDGISLTVLDSAIFNPSPPNGNVVEISGRVIGTNSTIWPLYFGQNVGIGVNSPDEKLVVDGKIKSEEIKVEVVNGPDYVFESDYQLPTLLETKEYISANKHLPEIPSAKEMETNGIDLGEMNMKLLKKIEELTLHMIRIDEQLQDVKFENQKLKAQINN